MMEVPISVFKKGTPENRLWGNKNPVMKCAKLCPQQDAYD